MSKKKVSKVSFSMLKYNAIKLRNFYQLPYKLVYYITLIDKDTDISWVKFLQVMTEHLLRVRGYYKRYPEEEKKADELIESAFKSRFVRDYMIS